MIGVIISFPLSVKIGSYFFRAAATASAQSETVSASIGTSMPWARSASSSRHRDRRGEPLFLQQADLREDLLRRTVSNDGAVGEHDHAVGADALLHMVCDEHDRDALLTAELCRRVDHLAPSGRVEHGRRLVEHDALGLHGDDARDGDALLLSAGEQVRRVQAEVIHADLPEGCIHARADLLAAGTPRFSGAKATSSSTTFATIWLSGF